MALSSISLHSMPTVTNYLQFFFSPLSLPLSLYSWPAPADHCFHNIFKIGAPNQLPLSSFINIGVKRLRAYIPKLFRLLLVSFLWGIFLPLVTSQWYNVSTQGVLFIFDLPLTNIFRNYLSEYVNLIFCGCVLSVDSSSLSLSLSL